MSGKEKSKMPHKISHEMIMVSKYEDPHHWMVSGEITSQEKFMKNDIK